MRFDCVIRGKQEFGSVTARSPRKRGSTMGSSVEKECGPAGRCVLSEEK